MDWLRLAVDYGVIGLLLLMSIIAVATAIERYLFYRNLPFLDYTDKKTLELDLTEKLHLIATIGSNAPYVGLLGTVLGIMLTFYAMGKEGLMNTETIMLGLALALKATAVGLIVAIPAIILYNFLLRRVRTILLRWEIHHGRKGI